MTTIETPPPAGWIKITFMSATSFRVTRPDGNFLEMMMNEEVTLQVGEAKITLPAQAVLASFLEKLGMQIKQPLPNPARPELREGEYYAGIILGKDGEPDYHLILLPSEAIDFNWKDAKEWAASQGGELPTRREQSLLFANLKEQFRTRWYWSSESHEEDAHYAWYQRFDLGHQDDGHKGLKGCARAVRRLSVIE